MPTKEHHPRGAPSWVDLSTSDPEAAQAFYGAVLGWDYEARDTQGGPPYLLARRNGHKAAGMMQQPPEQAQMGIPTMWTTYIAVDDVDTTLTTASEAGGAVIMGAMDVMTEGRMAVLADPSGAVVGVWQAGDHTGAEIVNEAGALCWNEVQTPGLQAAADFYGRVFGWEAETMDMGDQGPYTVFTLGGEQVAGGMAPPMEGIPPHWSTVFAVEDTDAAAVAAVANGGAVMVEPFDMPIGRLAVLADGQGATFQVIAMADEA